MMKVGAHIHIYGTMDEKSVISCFINVMLHLTKAVIAWYSRVKLYVQICNMNVNDSHEEKHDESFQLKHTNSL